MAETSGPQSTEERLRSWLNNNQSKREQMCLALLPLLGPYSNLNPRRPQGGRDGARDIEALYQGSVEVWVAVGFQNDASGTTEHRRKAEHKFKNDLQAALSQNDQLKGFVFMTNVDLTPTCKDALTQFARDKGLEIVEIYDFNILRHYLDSAEGLIARVQYLDLPMTPTEQVALVSRYGSRLQSAVTERIDSVSEALERIEFLMDSQAPVRDIDLELYLDRMLTTDEFPNATHVPPILRRRLSGLPRESGTKFVWERHFRLPLRRLKPSI